MVRTLFLGGRICVASVAALAVAPLASAAISIDVVPVGNVNNTADTTGFGGVSYAYNMGKFDITATQYTAFLNAVAQTDTFALYNTNMFNNFAATGISRSGSPGSFVYATTRNGNNPVNYVSFWDALRFVNWLDNGQPIGAQGSGTTETGSYTITPQAITSNTVSRNAGHTWYLPSENEWYKAAYYDPSLNAGAGGYWLYATRSNTAPSNALSAVGTNNANYAPTGDIADPTNFITPVGFFAASASAYGTFDQNGDVYQWDDTLITISSSTFRGIRGGSYEDDDSALVSSFRDYYNPDPSFEFNSFGFRVVQIPVPEPASLAMISAAFVACGWRRMRRGTGTS